MNRLLLIFAAISFSLFCSLPSSGQSINWVKTAGSVSDDNGEGIQVDAAGNLYVLGHFSAPSALFGTTTLSTSGTGTYLTKYSNSGGFAWARKISDTNLRDGSSLKTDAAGNSYLTTTFTGSVTLGGRTLTSNGAADILIAKYNNNGDVVWATKAGGSAADKGNSIAIDAAGNSYLAGSFQGAATFGSTVLSSQGSLDAFVAKLNPDGSFAWAQQAGGTGADEGTGAVVDASGNVYITGNFAGTLALGSTRLASSGGQDIFLAAYSNSGSLTWAQKAGGAGADKVTSLALDAGNNLYLGGNYNGTAQFGTQSLSSAGGQDIFLAKYSNTGTSLWAKSAGGAGTDELNGLSADANGNLYLTGSFSGTASVGGITLRTTGGLDIFAAHYLGSGVVQWAIGAGSGVDDRGFGIVSDAARNAYVTGYFQGATTSFGGIPIPNRGGEEIFISKLLPALVTTSVTNGPYCAGQAVTVNYRTNINLGRNFRAELSDATGSFDSPVTIGTVTSNTGSINAVIPASAASGSKYRIRVYASDASIPGTDNGKDLTINALPAVPTLTSNSPGLGSTLYLTATTVAGATYSWTGPNGFTSKLQNPTRPSMTSADAGTYTLTVNVNGCTRTASINVAVVPVPTYDVDLTGKPNGTWDSGTVNRNGQLCGATGNDNCIQFNITLDRNAAGLEFAITDGPVPSGSMGYQIDCGGYVPVGQPICVEGTGPHVLTLCMPGNAKGRFVIKSIAAFEPQPDLSVTAGCSAILRAPIAFEESSITWRDITGGGAYDKYLSFPNGKANPVVTPDANVPAFVDYEVCGASVNSPCSTLPYCDVVRVYFYPEPVVTIGPEPAIICPGGNGVDLVGNVTGGSGNFSYLWTDSSGKLVGTDRVYRATAVGTYTFEARNENYPNCKTFSASVNVVSNLTVNAGPDQLACSQNAVQLAGAVTAATGGIWSGGRGVFSPSNTALNAVYTPTADEIRAGSLKLTLTSTGNGSCSPLQDEVLLTFYSMNLTLSGTSVVCGGATGTVAATVVGGQAPVTYKWSSGETTATISNKPAGTYTVSVSDGQSCSVQQSFTITEMPGPSDFTASLRSSTCGESNGSISVGGVTGGTPSYTYSRDGGSTYQASAMFSGLAAGNYTITVKDANGCTTVKTFTLANIAGPSTVTATATPASCANNDGQISVSGVNGGTPAYTYSIDGTNFQAGTVFTGLASGTYTLTAKDNNQCRVTTSVTVLKSAPTAFTATATASTCGNSNGSVAVSGITGGKAPYKYSADGVTFQTNPMLEGLAAGTYTVTVKDDNGCTFAKTVTVTNIAGPSDLTASVRPSTCGNSNAELTVTGASGGTQPYAYSLDGVTYQSSAGFAALTAGSYTVYVKDARGCVYAEGVTVADVAGPAFTTIAEASTCGGSNGSITVSASGGAGSYTYSKDGVNFQAAATFANLVAGSYSITVKDANGCTLVKPVAVSDIAGPANMTLTADSSTCGGNNGSVVVSNVSGGAGAYTYSKDGRTFQSSTSFGSLVAGDYTITVKDSNGCTFSKAVTVGDVAGPTNLTATTKSSTCGGSNGELNVTGVSGGVEGYTYRIDNGAFQSATTFAGLAAGAHTVTVKDANGCTFSKSFTVANIAGPTAVAATAQSASCANNDGSILVGNVIGGTTGYTYSINGTSFQAGISFTGLASGDYTLTAKDANGCTVTTIVKVGTNAPTAFAASVKASTCGASNGEVTVMGVTGGAAPYTYSKGSDAFQASATLTGLAAGVHRITVKDAKGCVFTKNVTVTNISGPSDLTAMTKASTCGNSNGELVVAGVSGGTTPYTYAINGKDFQSATAFTGLAEGVYTVTVKDANGCVYAEEATVSNIAGPSFTLAAVASTCGGSNGRVTVENVTGAAASFTYSRDGQSFQDSNVFTGLAQGTYTITVKDANGCTLAKTIEVTNIPGPSGITLAGEPSTCGAANGTITVTAVAGGTPSYTYALDGGAFQASLSFGSVLAGEHTVTVKDANGCTFSKKITLENIAGPTGFLASAKASTCGDSNGELNISGVSGGTSPYTYSRDGVNFQASANFTGLMAGTHTITVKDANGCTFTKAATVTNIAGPTAVAASTTPASCADNDGSIQVGAVSGGTAPYTYAIDGTNFKTGTRFTALAAGTYTVTAKDANGCTVTASVTVGANVPTSFTSTTVAASCGRSDGELTITTVSGGTAPYTYSKGNAAFQSAATFGGLAAGTYTITVKDANGCTFTEDVAVRNVEGPTLSVSAQPTTCGGTNGHISVSNVAGGVGPYTYSMDGVNFQEEANFGNLTADTYTVSVKDAKGCLGTATVQVEDIAGPSDISLAAVASTCGNRNAQVVVREVTGGTSPYTYSKDGVNFQSVGTFTGLMAGTYTITVKDANGCIVTKSVEVEDVAGPTQLTLQAASSTCGDANGAVSVTGVSGGTAPYTYAVDGGAFQTETAFASLLAGEHTVTVKDANGCTFAAKIVVENITGPSNLTAVTKASTCGASNGELKVTGVSGGTSPYTYSIDGVNFQATATFTALEAGSYTTTVKDANGCIFTKNVTVANVGGPTAVATTIKAATCADNDGTITVTGVTGGDAPYSYALNGGAFQSAGIFTALASGEYTLTAKDAKGCVMEVRVTVSKSGPADFTSVASAASCGNSNGSIRITAVAGGAAPYTYALNGGAFQSTAAFTGLPAGTYRVEVKDANNCSFAKEVQVNNVAGPSGLEATVYTASCGNSNGQVVVAGVTGGTVPYTYAINGKDFQSAAAFTGLAAGAYQLSVKDANGCTFVTALVVPNATGPADFAAVSKAATCGNSNGEVTVTGVTDGTAPFAYSHNGTTFQAGATLTGLAAGSYNITVKDANGCRFTKAVVVENTAGPTGYDLTATASTCGAANGTVTVGAVAGGTAPYTYALNGGSFQNTNMFAAIAAGEHTVTVKDANGCTLVKKVTVPNATGPSELSSQATPSSCTASTGSITVTKVTGGALPYTYSLDGASFQAANTFAGLAPAVYNVYVKDANGCLTHGTVTVTTNGPKAASSSSVAATCGESNGKVTVTSVTGGTLPLAYSIDGGKSFQAAAAFDNLAAGGYTIIIKDSEGCTFELRENVGNSAGATFTATGYDASCGSENGRVVISQVSGGQSPYAYSIDGTTFQATPAFSGLAEGVYQVAVKDAAGCLNSQTVTIRNTPPLTDLKAMVTSAGCGLATGQVAVDGVTGGTAPYTYSLDGKNFTAATTFASVVPGSYTLTVKDAKGCTFAKPVKVEAGVLSELAYVRNLSCTGAATGVIAFTSVGENAQTQYSIDNGLTFQKDSVFTGLPKGVYQLVTKFSETCRIVVGTAEVKEADQIQVEVTPLSKAIGQDKSGSAAVTNISGGAAPYMYSVDGGGFTADSVFTNLAAGLHTLMVKDSFGCTAEVTFTVEGFNDIDIPNGFTPNGDGINDKWMLKNLATLFPHCRVTVYNRWGSPVFESRGYTNPWDGTYNGKRLPDGTYYCVIEFGDGSSPLKRSVTIMR